MLEAAHIVEEKIKGLSWLATRIRSTSCECSHSHGHSRRQSRVCLRGHTKTPAGEDHARTPSVASHQENQRGRHFPSPSPTHLRRQVTFQDQKGESLSEEYSLGEHVGQVSGRSEPEDYGLGPSPTLEPELEYFLGGQHPCKAQKGVMTCHWSPPWKIVRCGWSGEHAMLAHWSGGRN